jgi:hypothetical protein
MTRDVEDSGERGPDDTIDPAELRRILGMEIPAIGLDSDASFERLMRALTKRRYRHSLWRLLIACSIGGATVIIGLLAMYRVLAR